MFFLFFFLSSFGCLVGWLVGYIRLVFSYSLPRFILPHFWGERGQIPLGEAFSDVDEEMIDAKQCLWPWLQWFVCVVSFFFVPGWLFFFFVLTKSVVVFKTCFAFCYVESCLNMFKPCCLKMLFSLKKKKQQIIYHFLGVLQGEHPKCSKQTLTWHGSLVQCFKSLMEFFWDWKQQPFNHWQRASMVWICRSVDCILICLSGVLWSCCGLSGSVSVSEPFFFRRSREKLINISALCRERKFDISSQLLPSLNSHLRQRPFWRR